MAPTIPGNQSPKQNLIRRVDLIRKSPEPAADDLRPYKLLFLEVLTVASALVFGYAAKKFLNGDGEFIAVFFTAALTAAVLGMFFVLTVFLTKNMARRFLVILFETAAILLSFYSEPITVVLFAGGIIFVFLAWGEVDASRELDNSLKIRFARIAKLSISKFTTAIILVFIFFYLSGLSAGAPLVSQKVFKSIFEQVAGAGKQFYPELNLNSSFYAFSKSLAQNELRKNSEFKFLNPQEKETALNSAAAQILKSFEGSFGVSPKPDAPLHSVMYEIVITALRNWQNRFGVSFLAVWGILLFFTLEGICMLFRFAVLSASFLAYNLLLAIDMISIAGESRTRETIDFT